MPTRDVIFNIIGRETVSPAAMKAGAAMDGLAAKTARASERMVAAGTTLSHRVTVPILALAGASIKAATDFNASMARIQTQAGGSARDVQFLTRQVLAMRNTQQGPNQLAESLYHLKSVGMENVQAMHALRQASDLAAVGHANLEETTNALAGAWRTGIPGAKNFHQAVATINAAIGSGNMSLEDFNAALGTGILPSAKTFGLTLKDVGSALALFTDEGVPADAAATRLRMTFSLLAAPTGKAADQLKTIGLSQYALANDMRKPDGLLLAITDLKQHLDASGLSATKQAALLSRAFGGGRSSSAILSLVNNLDVLGQKYDQNTKLIHGFNAAVKAQQATPAAQFQRTLATLERTGVVLGTDLLPVASKLASGLEHVVGAFDDLSPGTRKFIIEAGLAAAAVGPLLLVGGKLVRVFTGAWRVLMFPQRVLLGWGAASRTMATTGAAADGTASKVSLAALKFNAAQLSEQSAAERSAAIIAVAESNKATAAADSAAAIARAVGGTDSVLAASARAAARDAEQFAVAMKVQADAAVKSAATMTVASQQATQALGREATAANAMRRRQGFTGAAMGLGLGAVIAGQYTHGQTSKTLTGVGTGAMLGSFLGPEGAAAGAAVGLGASTLSIGGPNLVDQFRGVIDAKAIQDQIGKLNPSIRFSIQNAIAYKKALAAALSENSPAATAHLENVAVGIRNQARASQQATTFTEKLAHGTADLAKVADLSGSKIISLSAAISGLSDGMLGLAGANLSFKIGLKDLPGQLAKHNKAIVGDTKAALDNRQALVGLLGQVQAHASAMEQAGKQAPAIAKAIDGDVNSLKQVALHAGVSKTQFENLIKQMHLTPKLVRTQILADTTSAKQKIADVQTLLNNLANGSYVAHVSVAGTSGFFGAGDTHITNPGHSGGGHFATGTGAGVLPQGWAWVGDPGPHSELTHTTPRGTQVFSAPESRRMAGAMGIPVPAYGGGTGSAPAAPGQMRVSGGRVKLIAGGREFEAYIEDLVLDTMDR